MKNKLNIKAFIECVSLFMFTIEMKDIFNLKCEDMK